MANETTVHDSRRAILAAGAGGLAAVIAQAIGRPFTTLATHLPGFGHDNTASATTNLTTEGTVNPALQVVSFGSFSQNTAIVGVSAQDTTQEGLPPAIPANTAVYGYSRHGDNPRGVVGEGGTGVLGLGGIAGIAVRGNTTQGIAGYFQATTGKALYTQGAVQFFGASGLNTILAGTRSKTVYTRIDVTNNSKVLVTLMSDPGGTTTVQRVRRDVINNRFTVYLTANARSNTQFAYFLMD
jgi:hypothetical protein